MKALIGIIAVVLIAVGAYMFFAPESEAPTAEVTTSAAIYFREELQGRVVSAFGQPIEGFEPFMFMQAYPGIAQSDFENVAAAQGKYTVHGSEVVFDRTSQEPEHSAARAITQPGMRTLLANVATRLGMPATSESEINAILTELR